MLMQLPTKLALLALPQAINGFVAPSALSQHVTTIKTTLAVDATFPPPPSFAFDTTFSTSLDASFIEPLAHVDPLLLQHVAIGGALAFAGDVIAQSLLSKEKEKSIPPKDWDAVRTSAFVVFGALYTGGAQHFIFQFINDTFPTEPLMRLAAAQFFFIPFCYYPTFLLMVPALRAGWESAEGFGSEQFFARQKELFTEVASKIPPTLLRNWCFWLPVQFVQFNFIPPEAQVTFTAAFGVIWNAILSWSTASSSPADDTTEKTSDKVVR